MEDQKRRPKKTSKKMTDKRRNNKENCLTNPKDNEGCSTPTNATVSDAQSPNTRRAAFKDVENTSYGKSAESSKKCKRKLFPDTADQTSDHLNSSFSPSPLSQYPWVKEQGKPIEEALSAEAKKQGTSLKTLLESQRADSSIEFLARVIKMMDPRLDSVGLLLWDNQGITGRATCFVFKDSYILISHHVIRMIVGERLPVKFWARVLSNVAQVTVADEEHPGQFSFYSIEPWLGVPDKNLDYALLKLKENHNPIQQGLNSLIFKELFKEPVNGSVYILGHPEGNEKKTNECTVIPINCLHEKPPLYIVSESSFSECHPASFPVAATAAQISHKGPFSTASQIVILWLRSCGVDEEEMDSRATQVMEDKRADKFRICSQHFSDDQYESTSCQTRPSRRRLIFGALPNQNLGAPSSYAPVPLLSLKISAASANPDNVILSKDTDMRIEDTANPLLSDIEMTTEKYFVSCETQTFCSSITMATVACQTDFSSVEAACQTEPQCALEETEI